jgi:hypothetical protein
MLQILAALFFGLSAPSVSPNVIWRVDPDVTCLTAHQLQTALETHLSALPETDRPDFAETAAVTVQRGKGHSISLQLSVARPPVELQREIPTDAGARCSDIAHTVAILVVAWLLELKQAADEASSTAPMTAPPEEVLPPSLTVESRPPPATTNRLGLELQLAGGALLGQGPAVSPAASLGVEMRIPPLLGIGLRVSWLGNLSVSDSPFGSIGVQRQIFGAFGAVSIPPVERWVHGFVRFRPYLGPVVWHAIAHSNGYQNTVRQEEYVPGFQAGILIDKQLIRPLFVSLQVGAIGLVQSTTYTVTRAVGPTATLTTLEPWALDLALAVGAQVF